MRPTRETRPRPVLEFGLGTTYAGDTSGPDPLDQYVLVTEGGRDTVFPLGDLGATESIDPTNGNVQEGTLDDDCAITLLAPDTERSSAATELLIRLYEDETGGWEPTFAASGGSIVWLEGSTPTHDTTAETLTEYLFRTYDDGVVWIGSMVGGSGGSALIIEDDGTPLATAATTLDFVGAGVTATGAGTDKTITIPGGANASDTGIWRPLMDSGTGMVIVDGATGEATMGFGPA